MTAPMGALAGGGVDPLTGPAGCDPKCDLLDRASEFGARRRRQRRHMAVSPRADQAIGNADAN